MKLFNLHDNNFECELKNGISLANVNFQYQYTKWYQYYIRYTREVKMQNRKCISRRSEKISICPWSQQKNCGPEIIYPCGQSPEMIRSQMDWIMR